MHSIFQHLKHFIKASQYSFSGLLTVWKHEIAFRQECLLFVVLSPLALALPIHYFEKLILISSLFLVIIVEVINSAIEAAVDHAGLQQSEFARKAKDMGSAAVLLSLVMAGAIWIFILFKHFY
jgi:diacylglycerol kinase (ATP)